MTTPASHLPLRRLALCLDCEACFDIRASACPACGGDTWILMVRFLDHEPIKTLSQFHPLPKSWAERSTQGNDASGPVVKQLLIIARDRPKLYAYAKRAFSDNSTVEVILDRRSSEKQKRANAPDRRRAERLEIDNHLEALGWAIVRLDVFRIGALPERSTSR